MINRELIRLKVVQLIYAYYQNEGKTIDVAEKELNFSMDKAYELYHYLLNLLVEIKHVAEHKEEARVSRNKRLGTKVEGAFPETMLFLSSMAIISASHNNACSGLCVVKHIPFPFSDSCLRIFKILTWLP